MIRLATVFAALLLIFAGNVRNSNAAVNDNPNRDIIGVNVVLDGQDLNDGVDGVVFTVDNPYFNVDADRFLNVEDNRGLDVIDNGNDKGYANLDNCDLDVNDQSDKDGGDVFNSNELSSDIRA